MRFNKTTKAHCLFQLIRFLPHFSQYGLYRRPCPRHLCITLLHEKNISVPFGTAWVEGIEEVVKNPSQPGKRNYK
jgi:hypothetical protein